MVHSFDILDTCLARLCGEPRNLFEVLSKKVIKIGENCGDEYLRELFVAARSQAPGVSLEEIYTHVAKEYPIPCSISEMIELELETEKEMLVPILSTLALVERLRTKGRIIFISDMYLPSDFLRARLMEYGFFKEGDAIYVSDELGASKRDGSLFKLIHVREHIPYRHWHHYGDNYRSDYRIPRKMGIHAHHIHYDYLPYEKKWGNMCTTRYQYPSILAGISRAVRLSNSASDWQSSFICDISGPFMVSWVLRVMKDAQTRGIKRLYFCARDVHSEYLIAKKLCGLFPGIEVHYLFISRASLYNSSLIWEYLNSIGLASDIPSAIVDSVTSGKTLYGLNNLLSVKGFRPIRGYFICKNERGIPSFNPTEEDTSLSSYEMVSTYLNAASTKKVRNITGMGIFFELLFSLNFHSKVIDYESRGESIRPVFHPDTEDYWCFTNADVRTLKRDNDALLINMARAIMLTGLDTFEDSIFESIALPTLSDFISYPPREYLNYLHRFQLWGEPFVEKIYRKQKGIWKRGNTFYSLPTLLSRWVCSLLSSPHFRQRMNQIVTVIKR